MVGEEKQGDPWTARDALDREFCSWDGRTDAEPEGFAVLESSIPPFETNKNKNEN